mgnify:FL=1
MRRRGFTLIELLIAFAISTVLLGAIYFFYVGFVKTGEQTRRMAFLNMVVDNKLEIMTRDLKSAVELIELHPRQIRFKRYKLPRGELRAIDLETKRLETVEYRVVKREGRHVFLRQIGFETPEELFRVRECSEEVFRGYVLLPPPESGKKTTKKTHNFPRFKVFDTVTQSSSQVDRVPLIKITMKLKTASDTIHIVGKVFLSQVYANLVEPDWNAE